ncbi:MAG: glycosyl hydrolase family protein [Lachnospiraceae bacterium]|nr:glycosyl hydrolase family protein [Lachnospiraceae bacterium]
MLWNPNERQTFLSSSSSTLFNKYYETGLTKQTASEEYHTYAVEWTDKYIEFQIDGRTIGIYDPSKYNSSIHEYYWPFNHDFFFVLNCAIGGISSDINDYAKSYDATGWTVVKEENNIQTLEDYFYIDYVRVYR